MYIYIYIIYLFISIYTSIYVRIYVCIYIYIQYYMPKHRDHAPSWSFSNVSIRLGVNGLVQFRGVARRNPRRRATQGSKSA